MRDDPQDVDEQRAPPSGLEPLEFGRMVDVDPRSQVQSFLTGHVHSSTT